MWGKELDVRWVTPKERIFLLKSNIIQEKRAPAGTCTNACVKQKCFNLALI